MSRLNATLKRFGLRAQQTAETVLEAQNALRHLRAIGTKQRYPAGARLFLLREDVWGVFLIEDGVAKLTREGTGDKEFVACLRSVGWLLGSAQAIARRPYSGAAIALHELHVRQIPAAQFIELVRSVPDVSAYVHDLHAREVCDQLEAWAALALLPARARLLQFLTRNISDIGVSEPLPLPPLLHRDIAAAVSVTPTHLSRLLRELEHDGLIERRRGRIAVRNHRLRSVP
jgi:CRP/FNR family transcriptional regulator, polysaccharide utilization system transcription regulator